MEIKKRVITLNFDGFYAADSEEIPDSNGIYVAVAGKLELDLWMPSGVLYIGKSEDDTDNRGVRGRILDHLRDDHKGWEKHLNMGETIQYAFAEFDDPRLADVEKVLIYVYNPDENTANRQSLGEDFTLNNCVIECNGIYPLTNTIDVDKLLEQYKNKLKK